MTYRGQNVVNLGAARDRCGGRPCSCSSDRSCGSCSRRSSRSSLLFGVLLIMPIGGADMPTVISLLNAYAGLSAVAMGFVLENKVLITAGALDGSSGLILSIIMCRAMNRSFTNVLFGAFGQVQAGGAAAEAQHGEERHAAGCRRPARERQQGRHRAWLRHGRRAGAAPRDARSTISSRSAASTSSSRSIRSPAACPGT